MVLGAGGSATQALQSFTHKYLGTGTVSAHRTQRERIHQGFPDACDKRTRVMNI